MQAIVKSNLVMGAALASFTASTFTAATSLADTAAPGAHVLGYQDTRTGTFHALRQAVPDATTAPTIGTVEVTINIKLLSTFAKGTAINCSIYVTSSVEGETAYTSYDETAVSSATISGSTATCTTTLPYSWLLPAATAAEVESFAGNYTVSAYPANSTSPLTSTTRSSGSGFVSLKTIPASGTVSKYTVNATL